MELAYNYGTAYWETFADQMLDIEYSKKQDREAKKLRKQIEGLSKQIKARDEKIAARDKKIAAHDKTINQLHETLAALQGNLSDPGAADGAAKAFPVQVMPFSTWFPDPALLAAAESVSTEGEKQLMKASWKCVGLPQYLLTSERTNLRSPMRICAGLLDLQFQVLFISLLMQFVMIFVSRSSNGPLHRWQTFQGLVLKSLCSGCCMLQMVEEPPAILSFRLATYKSSRGCIKDSSFFSPQRDWAWETC